jgi:hypothetical protein
VEGKTDECKCVPMNIAINQPNKAVMIDIIGFIEKSMGRLIETVVASHMAERKPPKAGALAR